MKIASAQIESKIGAVKENLEAHYRMIDFAAKNDVDLILFPELSITGYCREEGMQLSMTPEDDQLQALKQQACKHDVTIIAGAPIRIDQQLCIGAFIFKPDNSIDFYTKQFLHDGEELFYGFSFEYNPVIELKNERISLAICADISHADHPKMAKANHCTLYLPGLFFTENGITKGHEQLSAYAKEFSFDVLMSNYCGRLWNTTAGGRSAFWDASGELLAELSPSKEGILILEKNNHIWQAQTFEGDAGQVHLKTKTFQKTSTPKRPLY